MFVVTADANKFLIQTRTAVSGLAKYEAMGNVIALGKPGVGQIDAILMGTQAGKSAMIILMNKLIPGDYSGIDHHIYLID